MSSTQGFALDVFNNTSLALIFTMDGNTFLNGASGTYTISPNGWLSQQNNKAPLLLTLNDNDTGSLNFTVQAISGGTPGPTGSFVLEFDGTQLTNFPGMAFYGSAGDIAGAVEIGGVGYVFPLLYMNQLYQGNPLAVLMMVAGVSSNVNTPPYGG